MGVQSSCVKTVDLDLQQIDEIRQKMPILEHRRRDLYSLTSNNNDNISGEIEERKKIALKIVSVVPINDRLKEKITWGQIEITTEQIFFRTALSMALVNKKPVVPGRE